VYFVSYQIADIEGIGETYAHILEDIGITHVEDFLASCRTPTDRKNLADRVGVPSATILKWANLADMFRIGGVAEEWSELLRDVGVHTVMQLAQRNPNKLYSNIDSHDATRIVRQKPTPEQVEEWVETARQLPRSLEY